MKLITSVHINTAQDIGDTPVYERLELFDFESIELTSSIQDVRDIGSVFTDFSQQFTIPASQTNNRLLNHFYNESITNGYDARIKRKGYITLNGITFRDGYIRLSEAVLRNGKPYSYSITFFGQIVSLKDILGDDELKVLTDLSKYNHEYELDTVYDGFTDGLGLDGSNSMIKYDGVVGRDIIYPSISSDNKWYYDTSETEGLEQNYNQGTSKNIYVTSHSADLGIKYTELKPAIKVKRVIEAIEHKYNSINFRKDENENDFFASDTIDDLYLYLNKNKGDVKNLNDINESLVNGFTNSSDFGTFSSIVNKSTLVLSGTPFRYNNVSLTVDTSATEDYTLIIVNDGDEIYRETLSGQNTIYMSQLQSSISGSYTIYIAAETAISFSEIEWGVSYEMFDTNFPTFNTKTYNTGQDDFTIAFTFNMTRQMPKMKIIDFLKGLFNMFNLTAYVEGGEIIVKTLNKFYEDGNTIDLSSELDLSEVTVKRAELFSKVDLKFSDPKTFGVINQNEIAQDNFGNSKFQATVGNAEYSVVLDGGKYEIKLPFEKLFFERLSNEDDDGELIDFTHGWLVDKDQNEVTTAPTLFYNINTTIEDVDDIEIGFKGQGVRLPKYNRPSNINLDGSQTLHFDAEEDEFTGIENKNSLFQNFYKDYIDNLFNKSSRLVTYNTVLRLNTLLSYNMNDLILVNGKEYRINTIKTNLSNGKSEVELLTNFEITDLDVFVDTEPPSTPTGLSYSNVSVNSIDISWTASTDNVAVAGYNVFVDGSSVVLGETSTSYTITGLQPNTSYDIQVAAVDSSGNTSVASNVLQVTTIADNTPPDAINDLAIGVETIGTSISVEWTKTYDNVGTVGYDVYVKEGIGSYLLNQSVGDVNDCLIQNLTVGETYSIYVKAKDSSGNISASSNTVTHTIQ